MASRKELRSGRRGGSPFESADKSKKRSPSGQPEAADAGGARGGPSPTAVPGGPSQEAQDRVVAQEEGAREALEALQEHANTPVFEDCQQEDLAERL